MNSTQRLIRWLKDIQAGDEPAIPYNLHELVHVLHNSLGTNKAIKLLEQLDQMKDEEKVSDELHAKLMQDAFGSHGQG